MTRNSEGLRKAGVSAELNVYAKTPHRFGFREDQTTRPVDSWPQRFYDFLGAEGFLKKD